MNLIDTINPILNKDIDMPAFKLEIDTMSVVKACGVVLAMLFVYLILKKLI